MNITFTTEAQLHINKQINENDRLILFYDTEGCGCPVNGIPVLRVTSGTPEGLLPIETNHFSLLMLPKQQVFFDDDLKIDFIAGKLKLSSHNQIYATNLTIKRV